MKKTTKSNLKKPLRFGVVKHDPDILVEEFRDSNGEVVCRAYSLVGCGIRLNANQLQVDPNFKPSKFTISSYKSE